MGFPDQFPDVNSLEPRNRTDQTSIWSLALLKTQQPSVSIDCHFISLMARYIALQTNAMTYTFFQCGFCKLQGVSMWLPWAINSTNNNYWATKRFHHYWCSASKAPILCKSLQLFVHTGGMENKSLPAVFQRGYMMAPLINLPWTEQSTNLSTLSEQAFKTSFAWNKLPIQLIQNI